jgi:hypothetical protein
LTVLEHRECGRASILRGSFESYLASFARGRPGRDRLTELRSAWRRSSITSGTRTSGTPAAAPSSAAIGSRSSGTIGPPDGGS